MSRKILALITLMLSLIAASAIVPSSHAVEWSADNRLTLDEGSDSDSSITQEMNGKIWVVWSSDRTGNYEIFYKLYDGSSWSDAIQLTTDPHYDLDPAIMQAIDGTIWVAWDSDRNLHDLDLYYKLYDGSSWSDDKQLTADPNADDWDPSIMQAMGGMVWVVFSKSIPIDGLEEDLYYKLFNGTSWTSDIRLTWDQGSDLHPSIMQASNGTIWVVWDSDRNGYDNNIYYKFFDTYWTPDTKLTTDQSDDFQPSITQAADGTIWVVWTSTRDANFDIYYRTTIVYPHHDVAVIRVKVNSTVVFRGETVSVEVTVQNQGTCGETFETKTYANSTLIGSTTIFLSPGQTNIMYPPFKWNTTGVPRGTYIISATTVAVSGETDLADNSRNADGPVEVIIMGDFDGDGYVGPVDLSIFAAAYGKRQGQTGYNLRADLDMDGYIGPIDLSIFAANYGKRS